MMESLNQGYCDIMAMPIGRRKRICEEKTQLDKVRKRRQESRTKSKFR